MSIADEINKLTGGKTQSKAWYREQLEEKLGQIDWKNEDDDIDTENINPYGNIYYFTYQAEYPYNYPYYDRFPMAYIINIDPAKGKMFGANLHYLPPQIREGVAGSLINKGGEWRGIVPEICLHTYFIANCGTFMRVPSKEWKGLSKLPVQDFRSPNGRYVSDSKVWSGNGR
jgi:hypothetical protein